MYRSVRSLVIWFLALWNNLNLKQVGARVGLTQKQVSEILGRSEIPEEHWAYRFAKKHWFFGFGAYT